MAEDPVRLLVKNTFLQLDSEPTGKDRTRRRRSDGDIPTLLGSHGHVVPPGEFYRGWIEAGENDHVPQPDSPMRVQVPSSSKRGSRSQNETAAERPRNSTRSFSDASFWQASQCRRPSNTPQSRRPSNRVQRHSLASADDDDDDEFYDYMCTGAGMPPPMPLAMPPAAMQPGFGYNHYMPNPMLVPPGVDPWGYPNAMGGGWPPFGMPPTIPPAMPPGFGYNLLTPSPIQMPGVGPWESPAGGGRGRSNRSHAGSGSGKGNAKPSSGGSGSKGGASVPEAKDLKPSECTTVMMRNLPETYSRNTLQQLLDAHGFKGEYDLIYMPMNFRTQLSFGYAFANFVSNASAQRCHGVFQDFNQWDVPSDKVCDATWSNMHQGFFAHIDRYRNSPVMHESVPDLYKPAIFSAGERVRFPEPTKKVRVPRIRRASAHGDANCDDGADD